MRLDTSNSANTNHPRCPISSPSRTPPLLKAANDRNPDGLRYPQGQNKVCTANEFVGAAINCIPKSKINIIREAMRRFSMGHATAYEYWDRVDAA